MDVFTLFSSLPAISSGNDGLRISRVRPLSYKKKSQSPAFAL
jgi:hypothetical protein